MAVKGDQHNIRQVVIITYLICVSVMKEGKIYIFKIKPEKDSWENR